jgi:bifunctional non-homologous end joining protein LigD
VPTKKRPPPRGLEEYRAKRTFESTPEPPPVAAAARSGPLLFVVQQHAARRLHYDFRIELDGVLKSWAVPKGPSLNPAEKRLAVRTEDHPFEYASFEGVIPAKQYGAGEVIVWDCGVYTPDEDGGHWYHDRAEAERRATAGLEQGKLSLFLRGEKLKGSFALVRTAKDPKSWLLIKHKDRFVRTADAPDQAESIVSRMRVDELRRLPAHARLDAAALAPAGPREPLPKKLAPMLAEQGDAPFTHTDWMYEPKLDGYRVLAFIEGGRVALRSRRGLDLTPTFPAIAAELAEQAVNGMVLDGEIVAFGRDGRPSFDALQDRAQLKTASEIAAADRATPCVFYCFDLLHFEGVNPRSAPYVARRRYLAQCLLPSPHVQLVHAEADGEALYTAAVANGFEGIMAKRRDSPYQPGRRSPSWRKIKSAVTGEFVIGGYTQGKGSRAPLGAVLVGYWEKRALRFASHVGSGFDAGTLADLKRRLEPLKAAKKPFADDPELNSPTTWVKPELVAEVRFTGWTDDRHLRAPVFVRLRPDVEPKSVGHQAAGAPADSPAEAPRRDRTIDDVLAQLGDRRATLHLVVGSERLKVTHLDRVYWPADPALDQPPLTKRDLLRYLAQVSPFMLPHLADRPLTLIRMPEGIQGERFYQKRWDQPRPPFVETVSVFSGSKGRPDVCLLCNNLPTLLWLAQHGTLEYHVWHSRTRPGPDAASRGADFASSEEGLEASVLNYPDFLVFDIDPYIYSGKEAPGAEPELNVAGFEKGKEVAFWLRELLQTMGLEPIVKTSGKTGLHVFVPIQRTLTFDAAREVCEMVGRHLQRLHPKDITVEWSVGKRTGKIFIDYNMNVRGKTLNAAYSPRGLPGAPVSMPLGWAALATAHPLDFRITNALKRLEKEGDRWHNAQFDRQSLEQVLARARA